MLATEQKEQSLTGVGSYRMEQHAVPYPGLDVLRASITRILSQKLPCPTPTIKSKEATKLWLTGSAVIHIAVARQNPSTKSVDHVFLWIHTHLQKTNEALFFKSHFDNTFAINEECNFKAMFKNTRTAYGSLATPQISTVGLKLSFLGNFGRAPSKNISEPYSGHLQPLRGWERT